MIEEQYEKICVYQQTENGIIELVRDKQNGCYAILKKVEQSLFDTYVLLKNMKNMHLVQVYEVEQKEDGCLVVEEFMNGVTLRDVLKEKTVLSKAAASDYLLQICEGIAELHAKGIVHRDLNPNNIMLTDRGVIKVFDYNISRILKEEKEQDTTVLGTKGYAAPEQFGFLQTDGRSDIYAIGVMANEMLTGHGILEGIYNKSMKMQHMIERATQLEADKRFQTVEELYESIPRKKKSKLTVEKKFCWWELMCPFIQAGIELAAAYFVVKQGIPEWDIDAFLKRDLQNLPYFFVVDLLGIALPLVLAFTKCDWICEKAFGLRKQQLWFRFVIAAVFVAIGLYFR